MAVGHLSNLKISITMWKIGKEFFLNKYAIYIPVYGYT